MRGGERGACVHGAQWALLCLLTLALGTVLVQWARMRARLRVLELRTALHIEQEQRVAASGRQMSALAGMGRKLGQKASNATRIASRKLTASRARVSKVVPMGRSNANSLSRSVTMSFVTKLPSISRGGGGGSSGGGGGDGGGGGAQAESARKDWEILPSEIKMGEVVASGSFGEVLKGEYQGMRVAIKVPSHDIPQATFDKFVAEVELMTGLHHPNIVCFIGAHLVPRNSFLVLEYLEKGSLYDFLRSTECAERVDYPKNLKFALDTARGMQYLHARCKIIQRDLKSRNLLVDDSLNVKICDFGLSRYSESVQDYTACGTPYWAAPEVILGDKYDEKADVFSFAIVMWEIYTKDEPYEGRPGMDTAFAVAQNGLRPKVPRHCPKAYRELMVRSWAPNPKDRPPFEEILQRLFEMAKAARVKYGTLNMAGKTWKLTVPTRKK